jgi:hypothetical protein
MSGVPPPPPPQAGAIQVTDSLERRIRKPIDLLRCVLACAEIVALAVAGVAASATTTGVEKDIVAASTRLSHRLLDVAPRLALIVLLILPIAMAVEQIAVGHFRRLAEAVATGALAAAVAGIANLLLWRGAAARLYYAIIMSRPNTSHVAAIDPYLAGLVGFATTIVLTGRPAWRNALWGAVGVYAIVQIGALHITFLSLLLALLLGRAVGLAVRYVAGSVSQRPSAHDIAAALAATDLPLTEIRRVRPAAGGSSGSRHYAAATADGGALDIVVYDRDQQAAGAFYRLYRSARVLGQVSHSAPLSVNHAVERRALLSYAAEDAGAPTPRLRAVVRVGPKPRFSPTTTTRERRSPGGTPDAPTPSSAGSGTRCAACTRGTSRTAA